MTQPSGKASERLYFAFSPFLEPAAPEPWRKLPEGKVAEALGVDLLFNLPSAKWGGRIAGLTQAPGQSVFGYLYRVRAEDWPLIQELEGVKSNERVELPVRVACEGQHLEATAFSTHPGRASTSGAVSQDFADALARGAEVGGLPKAYADRLKAEALILQRVQAAGKKLNLL